MPITQYNSSVRQMSQSKFDSMKNSSGKIPDLANQIVMTNSENGVISSSINSTLLNSTKYNITTDIRVPISKATLQQYSYILIEIECYDTGGVNRISKATGYFKVSDLVEYIYANDYNSMSFYSRKYAVLGTINFAVNTNDLMFSCEFAKPYEQTNLNATADDQIYVGNIWGIK